MKLTERQLRRIIAEEVTKTVRSRRRLQEGVSDTQMNAFMDAAYSLEDALDHYQNKMLPVLKGLGPQGENLPTQQEVGEFVGHMKQSIAAHREMIETGAKGAPAERRGSG